MKIAIPVEENRKDVCASFGRAPWFLFYNTDTGEKTWMENPAAQSQGGAGLQAAQFVVDQGSGAVITVRCGQNGAEVLRAAEISIYRGDEAEAEDCLRAFEENRLELLTRFHAGFQGIQ